MKKRGFSIFKSNINPDQHNFEAWNERLGIAMPPLYQIVVITWNIFEFDMVFDGGLAIPEGGGSPVWPWQPVLYAPLGLNFSHFFQLDEVVSVMEQYSDTVSPTAYLPIACFERQELVWIGVAEHNQDQIFISRPATTHRQLEYLTMHSFLFVRGLECSPTSEEELVNLGLPPGQLVKMLGAKNWTLSPGNPERSFGLKMSVLDFLESRDIAEMSDTLYSEQVSELVLPPLYSLFLETFYTDGGTLDKSGQDKADFKLGENEMYKIFSMDKDSDYWKENCSTLRKVFGINEIIACKEEIMNILVNDSKEQAINILNNYLPIALVRVDQAYDYIVLVGITPENFDEIHYFQFRNFESYGDVNIYKSSKNIFTYLNNLIYALDDFSLTLKNVKNEFVYQQIHRKWGQEVWHSFMSYRELVALNNKNFMIKVGFSNFRTSTNPYRGDSGLWEQCLSISVPPLFKTILETWNIFEFDILFDGGLAIPEVGGTPVSPWGPVKYVPLDLHLSRFFQLEEVAKVVEQYSTTALLPVQYLPIAQFEMEEILWLGVAAHNQDQLFITRPATAHNTLEYLTAHCFLFVRGLERHPKTDEELLKHGLQPDQLIKMSVEEHWKVWPKQ